jgi:hypothetical protein
MLRPKDPLPGLWRREGLTPDLPLGFSLGGGWVARPAADPSQATGRVKRGATTSLTAPAYWKFESTPLQGRVMQTFGPSRSADLVYGAIRAEATYRVSGSVAVLQADPQVTRLAQLERRREQNHGTARAVLMAS